MNSKLKYGIAFGLAFIAWTMIIFLTGLDTTYIHIGYYSDYLVMILPSVFTFLAIKADIKNSHIQYKLIKGIKTGWLVNFVGYLIYIPFLIIYHHFINPDWLKYLLELVENNLVAQHVMQDVINQKLEIIKQQSTNVNFILYGFFFGVLIVGGVLSVISTLIIRKRKKAK